MEPVEQRGERDGELVVAARLGRYMSGDTATHLDLEVSGVKRLTLSTTDGGNGKNSDHADWGTASLACAP
ncbi:NPCBM/NEW2 domain-containing protein [Kribbella sp. NPDC051718]|uniref:NPCBM/NEW2 domain-containing protein n=1 Tax=Kribbella sp. NPDC051718 TaxID=3155168 RepID=UPI00344954C2